ncbi:GNAT family N-acetyltransferase [Streptomyces sp. NBC_00091]|uniref:GNAT family N-acetyltransferase n=1 Tax=Streptomyces sp. NBC_00091 TaxID=2975648 RepID=UPI00225AE964|nr:GNAT family N-acetyltransferase [Streptomyces sp. NBC_00091]MCX5379342.1 GNAT family N-acetyltransferase [Streptomyces sp. NBC_00091]
MIAVRAAGPGDGDTLGEIHAAAWEAAYAPFFDPEFAAEGIRSRRTRWHARLVEAPGTLLLAEAGGRPLAMSWSSASGTRPGLAEILSFYAHPDGWGSGVAAVLMEATLARLRADGFARAHLWTLRDTPRSRRFYAKCGFAGTGAVRGTDFGDGRPLEQVEYEREC